MRQLASAYLADIADVFGIDLEQQEPPMPAPSDADPCSTCRLRDEWCCDPWETPNDHEGNEE
ncbi:hypothetical protein CFREN_04250 [Corynebacterium freneyi]|nr:hypothetical protein CFREN_04250 [Corynebacterium freneyi]